MKNFILKLSQFLLNLIIVVGAVVSIFNLVMQLLPAYISQPVMAWLNTNLETILPYGIASTVTSIVLAIAKYSNTALKVTLKNSERVQELKLKQFEESYNERLALAEQRDLAIVEVINKNRQLLESIFKQNTNITEYEKLVAAKNIASSIIPDEYKEKFKEWIDAQCDEDVENVQIGVSQTSSNSEDDDNPEQDDVERKIV